MIDQGERTSNVHIVGDSVNRLDTSKDKTVNVPKKGKIVDAYELQRQMIAEDPTAWAEKVTKEKEKEKIHQDLKKAATERHNKLMEARRDNPAENKVGYLVKEPDAEGKERHFIYKEDCLMYLVNRVGMTPAEADRDFDKFVTTLSSSHAFSGIPMKE